MSKLKKYRSSGAIAGAALTGLCVYLAVLQTIPLLVWVALVPLFLALAGRPRSDHRYSGFFPGLIAGVTFSVFAFAWMVPGAHTFTGASMVYGIAIFLLCVVVFSLGCALLLWRTPLVLNYLVAMAILRHSWKYALTPLLLTGCYMLWGWWLLPPEILWDSANGNVRVQRLLQQEDICIAAHPRMLLWSESAIPWTWSPDDDLVAEILRHSRPQSITHVLGMNTAVSAGVVRNSAYCLLPDGKVGGRYDKEYAEWFIEQPWLGLQFPFLSSDGYSVEPGDNDLPLETPYGKAGVLICNESALPGAAARRVREGAGFLLNMSNDGWFRDTWLVRQHFYNARLRAVETRKDIAVNSNNGWSGFIDAAGRIDTTGFLFTVHPNDKITVAVRCPLIPVFSCLLFVLAIIIINKKPSIL